MALRSPPFSLGRPAEAVYKAASGPRQAVIDEGRAMSKLTITTVMPPDGYEPGDEVESQNQGLSAYLVGSLASQLMFMAFPPGLPVLRFVPIEYQLQQEIEQDPELWSKTELGLSRLEMIHREGMQTTDLKSVYVQYAQLLLVAGNGCWRHTVLEQPRFHTPEEYIVIRDKYGQPLLIIVEETVAVMEEDEATQDFFLRYDEDLGDKDPWERSVTVYTVQKLCVHDNGERYWECWQEYKGHLVPDTDFECDYEAPPLQADWLIPIKGKNWGRGYCKQFEGDLFTLEQNSSAINDGAAINSFMLLFVKSGRTSIKQVREAQNLEVIPGSAEDVSVLRTDKGADLNVVDKNIERVSQRLGRAFLSVASIQRQAERVTAEEWVRMGQELDKAMGGVYASMANGVNRPKLLRFIALNEEAHPKLPKLPRGSVEVRVATGLDAMGRSAEASALDRVVTRLNAAFGPQATAQIVNPLDYARRVAASEGIKPDGLIKSDDQHARDMQDQKNQAMQQTLMDKGTGPAIQTMGKALMDQMSQAPQQPPQEGSTQ
jgi:hypothetical protein